MDFRKLALVSLLLVLVVETAAVANPAPPNRPASSGFEIPADLRPECAYLANLKAPPANLTVKGYFDCLTDESRQKLDRAYQHKAARRAVPGAPANLDDFIAIHGDAQLAGVSLRDLAFGSDSRERFRVDVAAEGVAPVAPIRDTRAIDFGLDPTTCDQSCLSLPVSVVDATRVIGYGSATSGPSASGSGRLFDEVMPGLFPNHNQNDLANSELVASGCGPVSAVNLLEWWNIPIWHDRVQLTTFDQQTDFIADQVHTLDGINFTDDDDLFDFLETFPKTMYENGHTTGYPGWHTMRSDSYGWKVMMSYVARGYPVIALYATGSTSLHWAMVAGVQSGKVLIANAGDLPIADFYAQWDSWDALAWYASAAAELYVDEDTFIAYTGWGSSSDEPDHFARRTSTSNPGYTYDGTTYRFRYCVGADDDIGDAEADHVPTWSSEPSGSAPGYCMFESGEPSFKMAPQPSGGAASSKRGASLKVSVGDAKGMDAFIAANPGVDCEFWGKESTGWKLIKSDRCSEPTAREHTFTNDGKYSKVAFLVHSADLALTTWTISAK